jgi:hypothetical protein
MISSLFVLISCSKKADESLNKEQKEQDKNLEATSIDENDFSEADEDLMTVDYKEFYDQLAPHGEWIQVNPEDVGLKSKIASINSSGNKDFSISNLLGVNDAYALDANLGMTFVWKPSTNLAVTTSLGDAIVEQETPGYVPYTNGQWVNTDAGWYFKAPTPAEETVSHYGRWVNTPTDGWLWIPGRVWAPAWVDWKQNDDYVSWAPLPPSVYIDNSTINVPEINEDRYVIVEKRYFVEPTIYKYMYKENRNKVMIKEMTKTDGIMIMNKTIINKGPDVNIIQTVYGRNIELVKIQHVKNSNDIKYYDKEYFVYKPGFKKYKNKDNKNIIINEPKSFKKYYEWKVVKNEEKEYKKAEKEIKKDIKKIEKEIKKENKSNGNGNKHDGYDNSKKNNGNKNIKKNSGNENKKKNNGNESVKKNNNKENGNKQKSKDNKKGKK